MESGVHESNMAFVAKLGLTLGYLVLLMVSGLVGNTLVFLVYYKRFKPSVTRVYILAMSVVDLLNNCLALPSDIYEIRFHYDFDDDPGCKFFGFITRFLNLSSAIILIAIALDRRRMICQSTRKPRTVRHVYVELAGLGTFTACYAIPYGVLRGLQAIPLPDSDLNGTTCSIDDQYVGSIFFIIYNASTGLTFIISVSIMSVCYVLIGRHLWQHKKRLLHNAKKRQHRGHDQDSSQVQQHSHKRAEAKQASGALQSQQGTKDSANASASERSEDEGEIKASAGKLQLSMTEDSDINSDLDNTTTSYNPQSSNVLSTSLTNVSDTDTGPQPHPASGAVSAEDIITAVVAETGNTKPAPKTLREAAIVANACRSHRDSTTPGRPKVRKSRKQRGRHGAKKVPTRTTLMMFVLAAMFVVSYLPYLFMAALFRGRDMTGADFWARNLHQIALRSFFINSAVNPLVYSFCSVRFREECRHLLGRK
ncbi:hypothetical protein ACOMHN_004770 [Nucella lapillus]